MGRWDRWMNTWMGKEILYLELSRENEEGGQMFILFFSVWVMPRRRLQ